MNSMELVRFPSTTAPRPQSPTKKWRPPFSAELIGPVRNAIVRARHWLITQQRSDGSWLGRQSGDVSLASQLVCVLAFLGREDSELSHRCAEMILSEQRADGGWSVGVGGLTDVSASVQAYFALRLTGCDPIEKCMVDARERIRELGGADAADGVTRFFLALLGQLNYDYCGQTPPRSQSSDDVSSRQRALATVVWKRRPIYQVSIEFGVRELFINKPSDWPAIFVETHEVTSDEVPELQEVERDEISELSFHELMWQVIALRSDEQQADSADVNAYEDALEQLVDIDEATGFAYPRLRKISQADSAMALRALFESGISQNHPAIQEGLDVLCQATATGLSTVEACRLIEGLAHSEDAAVAKSAALPPDLDVRWDWQYAEPPAEEMPDWRREAIDTSVAARVKQCLGQQNSAGGWCAAKDSLGDLRSSDPEATGAALESLAKSGGLEIESALNRGKLLLQAQQCGDGRWERTDGTQQAQSTSAAIRGLIACGASADEDCIAAGVNWLAVQQQSNGSWRHNSTETALAILALVAAGKSDHPVVRRGVQFLLDSQEDQGCWADQQAAPHAENSARTSGDLQCSCGALLALSRFAVAASLAETAPVKEASLRLAATFVEN